MSDMNSRFPLGRLLFTRGVNEKFCSDDRFAEFVTGSLIRHVKGDWGDLDQHDKQENDLSIDQGFRIFSAYECGFAPDLKIWIITEADRSATTILFPSEY